MLCTFLKSFNIASLPPFKTSLLTGTAQSRPLRKRAMWCFLGSTSKGHSSGNIDHSAVPSCSWISLLRLTHKSEGIRSSYDPSWPVICAF